MNDWIPGAADQVDALASKDPDYQKLDEQRKVLERECLQILNGLSPAQQEVLKEYEYVIMEMAYLRTQAAYQVGKCHRLRVLPR